jgi:hypothetical protein
MTATDTDRRASTSRRVAVTAPATPCCTSCSPSPAGLIRPARPAKSCEPNRGPARAPIFLVNHWITTDPIPLPSNADEVNAYGPLVRRLRECERIRDHIPNLVAVNIDARGDLLRAVDTLNGVG